MSARRWRMFASRAERVVDGREFINIGDERTVRFRGGAAVPVELTEDPDGQYWGWVESPDAPRQGSSRFIGVPSMVQPSRAMFVCQSPDGFASRVADGYGEIVRLSCRALEEEI